MNKKMSKIAIFIAFFAILFMSIPAFTPGQGLTLTNGNQIDKTNATTNTFTFNTSTGTRLIYDVNTVVNGTDNFFTLSNYDSYTHSNYIVGNITQGDNIGFDFNNFGNNGTFDYVQGQIRSPFLNGGLQYEYYFVNLNDTLTLNQGPPLMWFVVPNVNFTQGVLDFQSAGFSATDSGGVFQVNQTWQPKSGGVASVYAKWDEATGSMCYYNYTLTGVSIPMALELSFVASVNPGSFSPNFYYQNPIIFYNIASLQVGNSNTLNFMNDPNSHGSISQGQNAMIQLNTYIDPHNGPNYGGMMQTLTGSSFIQSPFGNNNNNNSNGGGGPPDLVFIFPTSTNAGWWGNITLWLSIEGIQTITSNSTTITLGQSDPHNADNNVTFTLDQTTGFLLDYNLQTVDAFQLPGTNTVGVLNIHLKFLKGYDFNPLNPGFRIATGKQFKYHIDSLNINGSTTTPANPGTFSQGQDLHITFNALTIGSSGPSALISMATTTGQVTNNNISYDIFRQQNPPYIFFPVIPLDDNGVILKYFSDTFGLIIGASVTNNVTVVGFSIGGMTTGDHIHINHLEAYWNKTNGLLISYYFDAYNTSNTAQNMILKIHYIGEDLTPFVFSTNSTSTSTSSTASITAPGFEISALFIVMVPVVLIARKRKNI